MLAQRVPERSGPQDLRGDVQFDALGVGPDVELGAIPSDLKFRTPPEQHRDLWA